MSPLQKLACYAPKHGGNARLMLRKYRETFPDTLVLGLDISTRYTGWTILDAGGSHVASSLIDTRKQDSFISKGDELSAHFDEIVRHHGDAKWIVAIEQYLRSFRGGSASNNTFFSLAEVNAVSRYICSKTFNTHPVMVHPASVRTLLVTLQGQQLAAVSSPKSNSIGNDDSAHTVSLSSNSEGERSAFDAASGRRGTSITFGEDFSAAGYEEASVQSDKAVADAPRSVNTKHLAKDFVLARMPPDHPWKRNRKGNISEEYDNVFDSHVVAITALVAQCKSSVLSDVHSFKMFCAEEYGVETSSLTDKQRARMWKRFEKHINKEVELIL